MKRFMSIVLAVIMLLSVFVMSAGATGTLLFEDQFELGFKPKDWILDGCEFKWDEYNNCIHGYQSARVLQSNFLAREARKWDQFYGKFDVQFRGFDDLQETDKPHAVRIWYRDLFENPDDAIGPVYNFGVEAETGRVFITKEHTFKYRDENGILQDGSINSVIEEGVLPEAAEKIAAGENVFQVGEDAPWYEIGLRVTSGRIEGWIDQELVIFSEVDPEDEKLGDFAVNGVDATVGSQKSPFIFINGEREAAFWVALDNFEIWTPDYDFVEVVLGDVNGDAKVNIGDASLLLKKIAGWEVTIDESAADVNADDKINIGDVSLLLKKIAGWEVTFGPQA